MKKYKVLLLILALIFIFVLVYSPHLNYKYPFHVDEWQHLAKAVQIMDSKQILNLPPYFKISGTQPAYHLDLELGFHLFLAGFFLVTKLDPVLFYRFLPAIFAVLSALILFFLMYKLTDQFLVSIFSIVFFASLRSNVNVLGLWFFTPLTLAIPLIYLTILTFITGIEKNQKILFITSFTLLMLAFIHPVSFILVFLVIMFYLLLHKNLAKNAVGLLYLFALPLLTLLYLGVLLYLSKLDIVEYFSSSLIFKHGWGHFENIFLIPEFYGITATILALIGLYPAVKKRNLRILILLPLIPLILTSLFTYYKFSILIPYQRAFYYILIGLVPLSALGLYFIISKLMKYSRWSLLLVIPVLSINFIGYHDINQQFDLYRLIDDEDYNAMKFLGDNYKDRIVLASPQDSTAIFPISKQYVIRIMEGVLLKDANPYLINGGSIENFMSLDCEGKYGIIKDYDVDLILTREKIDCKNLVNTYGGGTAVYEVRWDEDFATYNDIMEFYKYSEDKNLVSNDIIKKLKAFLLRYPSSEYIGDASFFMIFLKERYGPYEGAIQEYKEFLEKYPSSKYNGYVSFTLELQNHINNNSIPLNMDHAQLNEESIIGKYGMMMVATEDNLDYIDLEGLFPINKLQHNYIRFWHRENKAEELQLNILLHQHDAKVVRNYEYDLSPSLNLVQEKIDTKTPQFKSRIIRKDSTTEDWNGTFNWNDLTELSFGLESLDDKTSVSYIGAIEIE